MFNLHSHFITSILLHSIAVSDYLLYDEFQFVFDLLNEKHWDIYHIKQQTQNTPNYHGRRLIHEFADKYLDEYASTCTHRIPVIFQYLCVDWSIVNGFSFHYLSNPHHSKSNKYETNWFYSSKNAAKYYSILDGDTWSMSNDKAWDEVDWISSLTHRLNDDINSEKFKQCRVRNAIEECASFDIDSNVLIFTIKVPKGRGKRHTKHHTLYPANIEINDYFDIGYDDIESSGEYVIEDDGYDFNRQFEYGDMHGYMLWVRQKLTIDDGESVFNAHLQDDNEIGFGQDNEYESYGDYMYYFDEYVFDIDNEQDWNEHNDDLSKCSLPIPALRHKLCVDHDNGAYKFRFAAVTNDGYGYNDILDALAEEYANYADYDDDVLYHRLFDEVESQVLDNLQHELRDLLLSFERDADWDEISNINDGKHKLQYTVHSTRKCKALQSIQICAQNNVDKHKMQINVKVGRHKYHRSSAHKDMMNELTAQFDYDLEIDNAANDDLQEMYWIMDHNILNVMDDEWNDPNHFKPTVHHTYNGHNIVRKCRATLCICQYINNPYDGDTKHKCKPVVKAPKTLKPVLHLANVLDAFLAPVHILVPILPDRKPFSGPSMLQRLPYVHIMYLRAKSPQRLHIHPLKVGTFQNPIGYRKHIHRIPWYKYRSFGKSMPLSKPLWIPQWMWLKLKQNMKSSKQIDAIADIEDYYHYDNLRDDEGFWGKVYKKALNHTKKCYKQAGGISGIVKKLGGTQGIMDKYNIVARKQGLPTISNKTKSNIGVGMNLWQQLQQPVQQTQQVPVEAQTPKVQVSLTSQTPPAQPQRLVASQTPLTQPRAQRSVTSQTPPTQVQRLVSSQTPPAQPQQLITSQTPPAQPQRLVASQTSLTQPRAQRSVTSQTPPAQPQRLVPSQTSRAQPRAPGSVASQAFHAPQSQAASTSTTTGSQPQPPLALLRQSQLLQPPPQPQPLRAYQPPLPAQQQTVSAQPQAALVHYDDNSVLDVWYDEYNDVDGYDNLVVFDEYHNDRNLDINEKSDGNQDYTANYKAVLSEKTYDFDDEYNAYNYDDDYDKGLVTPLDRIVDDSVKLNWIFKLSFLIFCGIGIVCIGLSSFLFTKTSKQKTLQI